ncbi:MAG: hypothetical protein ACRDRL_12270 [Sciscionella sp.]
MEPPWVVITSIPTRTKYVKYVKYLTGVACTVRDTRGHEIAAACGQLAAAGYVLYTGQQTLPFGPKLRAVPIDALWRCGP